MGKVLRVTRVIICSVVMSCRVLLWWHTALVCPCGQAQLPPNCVPLCFPCHHTQMLSFQELGAVEWGRFVFQLLEYRFSEQVINSHADFRQHYTNRKISMEIGPYLLHLSEGDIKRSTCDRALSCRHSALSSAKPMVCLQGCEQELWGCHFW